MRYLGRALLSLVFIIGVGMVGEYTKELSKTPYPIMEILADREGSNPKRYKLPGEQFDTIGRGHYIDNEDAYTQLTTSLGIKDKENLLPEEIEKLFAHDVNLRWQDMNKKYPTTKPLIKKIMLDERFRWSPGGFDKAYGKELSENDIDGLQKKLDIEMNRKEYSKLPGVKIRLLDIKRELQMIKEGKSIWQD